MDTPTASPEARDDDRQPVVVYEPLADGAEPWRPYLEGVRARRSFIWELARSDLKADHYDTVLGQIWLVLNPILMAAVWLLVRTVIRPAGDGETRGDIITHLMFGIFLFQFTAALVGGGTKSIVSRKGMLLNTSFPRLTFTIVDLLKACMELVPTLLVYSVIHVALDQPIGWALLWFPVFLLVQTAFSYGLLLYLAALTVRFRDVENVTRYVLRLWMFCSPILFTVQEIPENLLPYLQLNPLFPFFAAYEQIMDGVAPDPKYLLWGTLWAVSLMVIGFWYFRKKERSFAFWL